MSGLVLGELRRPVFGSQHLLSASNDELKVAC